jgi:hypothetical protein
MTRADEKICHFCGARGVAWRYPMRPYRVEPLILTAGYVGLRWGELAGLRVSRLRLLERKLNVVEKSSRSAAI